MFNCSTHLVECLRSVKIKPVATASSSSNDAKNALIYSTQNWYFTGAVSTQQWWKVDFKAVVSINQYQIFTYSGCHYITSWTIETSLDNVVWNETDSVSRTSYHENEIFTFEKPVNARYFKINGRNDDPNCTCPKCFVFWYVKFFGILNSVVKKTAKCFQNAQKWQKLNYIVLVILSS